ncbi:multiple PDZ domain protein-like isoform X7 [Mytilus californianus]|uniref:multiple PDZ domain protein-like isoform X7 n=1 Tax=Mytilus californianus TaxID=6549 RepID=UPI002245BBA7|nr:multiple PDZ domain protein-like isoform X7 [Mytilus californianus]
MSLVTDTDQASGFLDHLQNKLREQGDYTKDDDITSILSMLESPLFKQLLTLQESLHELKQVTKTYPVTENTFEISNSGELILNVPPDGITNPSFNDTTADTYAVSDGPIAMPSYDVEFQRAVERSAQGRDVETIKLFKPENSSLGFSVVGMKKKDNAESGIFIQDIQPGGIAARDGRLREQDQILAIDGQPLDLSHHEAIRILQSAQGLVQLVVARGQYPNQQGDPPSSPHKQQLSNVQSEGSADMVLNTEWTQIEVIDLINDGTGLGFGIIGGRSTGVVVKTILPGGIADINGRLHSGDHLLQIGDVNVRGMSSEQVAQVLRQSGSQVRLIVARPILEPPTMQIPHAPIVPTHQLDEHLHQINTLLDTTETIPDMADSHQQQQQFNQGMGMDGIVQVHHHGFDDMSPEYPEINYFDVELLKDNQHGLGITIAGYVGRQSDNPDDLCGIFVKSVAEGSAAGVDGRIQVNDQIIQVDNQSLQGFTNHQAVEVLRNTGQMVLLKLARYQRGPKFEKLQQYLAHPNINIPYPSNGIGPVQAPETAPPVYEPQQQVDVEDIPVMFCDEDYTGELLPDVEAAIRQCWEPIIGEDFEVVVSQLSKFREGGGLGISLEGTVDVENGVEVRPHHYIRSILHDGPVGINGRLKSGDELLEFSLPGKGPCCLLVNGKRLLGLNHKEVVGILKELPQHVRLVCARRVQQPNNEIYAQQDGQFFSSELNPGVNEMGFATERLVKAKSEMALASAVDNSTVQNSLNKMKSRSLEPLSNFAMWSSEPVVIELKKGDKGLGFSILDYQDPVNPGETVIVIKSLVPHGVAQQDGRLVPGDRLMFVNENNLENATLDEAVQALKGAPQGTVRIGVAKPLPFPSGFPGQNQQSVKTPSKESPLMRSPPPIPPKPVSPRIRQLKTKEAPPPLPVSSPPPLDMVNNSIGSPDQADAAGSIPIPHSSPQPITSDLKQASPSSSLSPGRSPISSPSLTRTLSGGADSLPVSLEKQIKIKKGNDQLGLTVESTDKGINGCHVKSIATNSAVGKDGRIKIGDYIVSVNNESTRKITNAQVRAIIRRASLLGFDISITYISSEDAAAYKNSRVDDQSPPPPTMMPSPKIFPKHYRANLSPLANPKNEINSPVKIEAAEKFKTAEVTRIGQQTWGPPRTVELYRQPDKSLGISIVGGRVDMFHVQDKAISGIFIKQVLEDSPAGKNGTLKTGDRILEVDGIDLRNASHDQAVDAIRNSGSPVKFVVQSLCDAACPRDLETEIKPVQSYDELQAATNTPLIQALSKPDIPQKPILNKPDLPEKQIVNKPEITQNQVDDDDEEEVEEEDNETEDEYGYTHKRVLRRYGDLGGEVHLVDLTRGGNGLGISLAGNKDRNTMSVFVAGIQPESVAAKDGRIEIGDELLEVNGQVLYGRSHLNASAIIKSVSTNVVKIVLVRREDNLDQMAVKPLRSFPPGSTEDISTSPSPPKKPVTSPENIPSALDVVQVVSLQKGVSGLGFAIVEEMRDNRQGIYIRSITQGGVAAQDGQLSVGDQILEVGDKQLSDVHYDKAIEILRNSQGTVRLKVRKCGVDTINNSGTSSHPPPVFQLDSITGETSTDPMEETSPQPETNDPKTCPIIPGRETYIEIEKGRTGLGLSIVGGNDTLLGAIIVHEVYEDGAASRDGRLWAGDQVLEVNNEELREASHDYAIQVLRQTPATVGILVFRDDNQVKEEDIYDIFTVELNKKQGRGLGLSIVGKRNDVGVYISDIVKGGVSESDGRLMQGDQILAVNGEDMRNATQEYAAAVLKTSLGKVTLTVGRLKAGSRASSRKQSNPGGLKKSESTASNKSKGGRHSKTVSEDLNHVRIVELTHDVSGSLGLSIAGGIGSSLGDTAVMIANLTPGGAAARSQKLKIGDKIIQINDRETDGMTHDDAVQLLKSGGPVTLMVTQGEETRVSVTGGKSSRPVSADMTPQDNAVFDDDGAPPQCKTITLNRGPAGLGFSIVGGHGSPHGDLPIYVKSVFAQGAASVEGNLKRGDQILSVNGQSLEGCTHEEAVNILKNAKGNVTLMVLSS